MKITSITLFAAGLLIAGSEGPYFPYVNMAGAVLLVIGAAGLNYLNREGLL